MRKTLTNDKQHLPCHARRDLRGTRVGGRGKRLAALAGPVPEYAAGVPEYVPEYMLEYTDPLPEYTNGSLNMSLNTLIRSLNIPMGP